MNAMDELEMGKNKLEAIDWTLIGILAVAAAVFAGYPILAIFMGWA